MKTINFFDNHNGKLGCKYFTTIRPEWDYYQNGEEYAIVLRKKLQFTGKIVGIRRFMLVEINPYISYLDYGKSPSQLKNLITTMFPKKDFTKEKLLFILIENINF